jgi:predicted nucleic acid-binding protein
MTRGKVLSPSSLAVKRFNFLTKRVSSIFPGLEAQHRRRRSQLQQWVAQDLPRRFTGWILPVDQEVATRWGIMTGEAERAGHPIPVLDGLVAATAAVAGLTLATRHTMHMQHTGAVVFDPWTG